MRIAKHAAPTGGTSSLDPRLHAPPSAGGLPDTALRWSARVLVGVSWISGAIFALYIIGFFGGAALGGAGERWNESLPGLYDMAAPLATLAIGAHFAAGGVLLLLGPVQLITRVRQTVPGLHRGLGRTYVLSAGLAGLGGLVFIAGSGTIGGWVMDVGFGLYGVLMVLCAAMAYRHARARRYVLHRAWAIRLFALTIGSWLYRMEYGTWFMLTGGLGVGAGFSGVFDAVMAFFFYVPNLVLAELFIRARGHAGGAALRLGTAGLLAIASALVILVTWNFSAANWGPRMFSGMLEALR